MARRTKYFISQSLVLQIVNFYGGKKKYKDYVELNKIYNSRVIYHEKNHKGLLLVIEDKGFCDEEKITKIEVHFCDSEGVIIKRDKWVIGVNNVARFLDVSTEGKNCKPVWGVIK